MLETAEERVKLLKAGFTGKEIEKLYIEYNNFKIIRSPILFDASLKCDAADTENYISNDII